MYTLDGGFPSVLYTVIKYFTTDYTVIWEQWPLLIFFIQMLIELLEFMSLKNENHLTC